jgi:hypothetical protein
MSLFVISLVPIFASTSFFAFSAASAAAEVKMNKSMKTIRAPADNFFISTSPLLWL